MLAESKKKSIILTEDHEIFRETLTKSINDFPDFQVIGQAGHGEELFYWLNKGVIPDIVILDINMPVMDGYETATLLKRKYPSIHILILSMYEGESPLLRFIQIGVKAYLQKNSSVSELHRALQTIAQNDIYYSQKTTGKLASLFIKGQDTKKIVEKYMLGELEIKFLRLASTDMTYKEIAAEMKMTPRCVDNYRDNLFDKLEVKSRVGLAIWAIKNGIVSNLDNDSIAS